MPRRITEADAIAYLESRGIEPLDAYPGTKLPWRCQFTDCGHIAETLTFKLIRAGRGCPTCGMARSAKAALVDPNTAEADMRAHGYEPIDPYPGEARDSWHCRHIPCGTEVRTSRYLLRQGMGKCPICHPSPHPNGNLRITPEQAAERRAQRAAESAAELRALGREPLEPYPGTTNDPWLSRHIPCGTESRTRLGDARRSKVAACKVCAVAAAAASRLVDPEQAAGEVRDVGLEPQVPYPGRVGASWLCRCTVCGKEPSPSLMAIRAGHGCRFCGHVRTIDARRTDADKAADEMRAQGLEPTEPFPGGVDAHWSCLCTVCGQKTSQTLYLARKTKGRGGPCCASNRPITPEEAEGVMRGADVTPIDPYPGNSSAPWRCRCNRCGHIGYPRVVTVQRGHGACEQCGYVQGGAKRRALLAEVAVSAMLASGFQPLTDYPGSGVGWSSRCSTCDRVSTPMYGNVRNGSGCVYCTNKGFKMDAPALVYVLHHQGLNAVKVGITNTGTKRLAAFQSGGWHAVRTMDFATGADAYQVEQAVLKRLRVDLGIPQYLTKEYMPYRGETETACADLIEPLVLWAMVCEECDRLAA
ncbi:hypothetical protein ACODT5_39910 [Streptomyces sp. 5.8]|uniref:hypothetical protein n=1 Tax=Streptomyces sp. 5.8 TaxID=3406571 RepID=UPI003BB64523